MIPATSRPTPGSKLKELFARPKAGPPGGLYRDAVRRICILAALSTLSLTVGTVGFFVIERQPLFDSFYMALITLTTVGYAETIELSQAGRYFNSILLLFGFVVMFVSLGMLGDLLIELQLLSYLSQRRTKRMIQTFSGHYIVCGLGRVGRAVIRELVRRGASIVAIDTSEAHKPWAAEQGVPLLIGDATLDSTLEEASVRQAKGLVAAISSDADNVYVTLTACGLNPNLRVAARATDEDARQKLLRAGAKSAFAPYGFVGFRLAQALLRPQVSNFLGFFSAVEDAGLDLEIDQFRVHENGRGEMRTLDEFRLDPELNVIVLGLVRADGTAQFNPAGDTRTNPGDVLIVTGPRLALERMQRELAD